MSQPLQRKRIRKMLYHLIGGLTQFVKSAARHARVDLSGLGGQPPDRSPVP
jgi:hypothetical protein